MLWPPHGYAKSEISQKFLPPCSENWLGTDPLGRDVVSQLIAASVNSLTVAFVPVGLGDTIGIAFGLLASARGDWVEAAIMRLVDLGFAFPALSFAIMLAAALGPSL